jgi:hypothetical protein
MHTEQTMSFADDHFFVVEPLDIIKKEPPDFVSLRLSRPSTNKNIGGSHVLFRYRFA